VEDKTRKKNEGETTKRRNTENRTNEGRWVPFFCIFAHFERPKARDVLSVPPTQFGGVRVSGDNPLVPSSKTTVPFQRGHYSFLDNRLVPRPSNTGRQSTRLCRLEALTRAKCRFLPCGDRCYSRKTTSNDLVGSRRRVQLNPTSEHKAKVYRLLHQSQIVVHEDEGPRPSRLRRLEAWTIEI
jgi:hypothetical protein